MSDQIIWVLVLHDLSMCDHDPNGEHSDDEIVRVVGAYQTEKIAIATMEDQEEYDEDWAAFTVQQTTLYGAAA